MSVDRMWLEQNGKKPTINAVPLAGSGYDRKEMLMRLYNKLDTIIYKVDKLQGYFTKDQVTHIIRKIQGLISDVIEERPIDEADFKEVSLMELLLDEGS